MVTKIAVTQVFFYVAVHILPYKFETIICAIGNDFFLRGAEVDFVNITHPKCEIKQERERGKKEKNISRTKHQGELQNQLNQSGCVCNSVKNKCSKTSLVMAIASMGCISFTVKYYFR